MSKPWDGLRLPTSPKPPIGVGKWRTSPEDWSITVAVTEMTICNDERYVDIEFSYYDRTAEMRFCASEARQIGEFLAEIADQLEGK